MNFHGNRLGFWFKKVSIIPYGDEACRSLINYFPTSDTYLNSYFGSPLPATTVGELKNSYLLASVNATNGTIGNNSFEPGLKFDPNGTSNYGVDDYLQPGNPYQALHLGVYSDNATSIPLHTFGFTNTPITGLTSPNVKTWKIADNHYIAQTGNTAAGFLTCQYKVVGQESAIRMKMSYTNVTGGRKYIRAKIAIDPDIDAKSAGVFKTSNQVGYTTISPNDIVYSIGLATQKALSIYNPGAGSFVLGNGQISYPTFNHKCYIEKGWPKLDPKFVYDNAWPSKTIDDDSIGTVWDFGYLENGDKVAACAYYLLGNNIDSIVNILSGNVAA